MIDISVPKLDDPDLFECAILTDERVSQDFRDWPEPLLKASDAAIKRLLEQNPGRTVISDTSECLDEADPRFPDGDEHKGKFVAIRLVRLNEAAPLSGRDRLRAFEVKVLGEDHPRPYGQIERGVGSHFSRLDAAHRAHHAALEELVAAEDEHRKAGAAEDAAHARLEAAIKRAAATEEAL